MNSQEINRQSQSHKMKIKSFFTLLLSPNFMYIIASLQHLVLRGCHESVLTGFESREGKDWSRIVNSFRVEFEIKCFDFFFFNRTKNIDSIHQSTTASTCFLTNHNPFFRLISLY